MKRFNGTEIAALILAAVLFFVGASMVISPRAEVIPHVFMIARYRGGISEENVSESGARKRGVIAMAFGAGLAAFTIYRGKT